MMSAQLLGGASALQARLYFPKNPHNRRHESRDIVLSTYVHRAAAQRLDRRFLADRARQKYERTSGAYNLGFPECRQARPKTRQREIRHDHVRSQVAISSISFLLAVDATPIAGAIPLGARNSAHGEFRLVRHVSTNSKRQGGSPPYDSTLPANTYILWQPSSEIESHTFSRGSALHSTL